MNKDYSVLLGPKSGSSLSPIMDNLIDGEGMSYPVIRGIPRFVADENYASDFGTQWNVFRKTQLRRLSPVHFYYPQLELRTKEMYYDWAFLDTHDGTTDYYKHLRTVASIRDHMKRLGAVEILVREGGNGIEASCRKPLEVGAKQPMMLRSNMIANCAFAMAHSRGGILHSFCARFNTRKRSEDKGNSGLYPLQKLGFWGQTSGRLREPYSTFDRGDRRCEQQ